MSRRHAPVPLDVCVATLVAIALVGCDRGGSLEPPTLHLGHDACDECHMIISDERFAAASLVRIDGVLEPRRFDDIGCLFRHEADHAEETVAARYVKAFDDRRWLDAGEAVYVRGEGIHSPMAFGVAALGSVADADRVAEQFNGEPLRFDTLRAQLTPARPGEHAAKAHHTDHTHNH